MWKPLSLTPGHGSMKGAAAFILSSMLATILESQVINLALPYIYDEYSVTKSTAQWMMTIFYLATATCAIPLSRLGDKYGYVFVELALTASCAVMYLAQYFIKNFTALLVFRFLSGMVTSGIISNRNTMNRVLPPPEKSRQFIQQTVVLMNSMSLATPLIGGLIIDYISWQSFFLFSFGFMLLAFVLMLFFTNPNYRQKTVRFDVFGSILLMLTLCSFCLFFTMISEKMYYVALICICVSVACGIWFTFVEKKHLAPILPQYIMKNPITAIFSSNIINYLLTTGISYILPQYASINNISSSRISLIMVLSSSLNLIGSIIVPLLQKKILNRILLVADYLILIVASLAMLFFINNRAAFVVLIVIMSTSISVASTILFPITLMSVPPQFGSQVSAIPTTGRTIGYSISYCLFSMLYEIIAKVSKKTDKHEIAIACYRASFAIYIPIAIFNCFLIYLRIGIQPTEQNKRFFKKSCVRVLKNIPLEENALIQSDELAEDVIASPKEPVKEDARPDEGKVKVAGEVHNDDSVSLE